MSDRRQRRFTDQLKVKLGLLTTLCGILGTIIFYTYIFAVDQTKKDFKIESNRASILQIKGDVKTIRDRVTSIDKNITLIFKQKLKRLRPKNNKKKVKGALDERFVLRKQ